MRMPRTARKTQSSLSLANVLFQTYATKWLDTVWHGLSLRICQRKD